MQTTGEIARTYRPNEVESRWYDWWDHHGYFAPRGTGEPFVIIMPPPNVTGELHMGHALFVAVEDILVRWRRMQGRPTLWLPGADHAGIGGQWVVERELLEEGVTRQDLGRERFLKRMWTFMDQYRGRIREQLRILGASCDWSRFTFTMDPGPARAVRTAFRQLYDKGLIYRGKRLINWCPRCRTVLSDLEVDHEEEQSSLWTIRYPIEGTDRFIEVATTRPETMLGDTAVAVHPDDERYRDLVGRSATLPIIGRTLPILADPAVDPEFGTGAVKVTPAHDPNDFEIGQRHGLPAVNVMNLDGTMNENAAEFEGRTISEARKGVVARLEREGYLVRTEPHTLSVGRCDRCGTVVEPMISEQWFVRMAPLNAPALRAVQEGRVRFIPERFRSAYVSWVEHEHDWCISRQLWWGHRIPVWYCDECGEATVSVEQSVERCERCGGTSLHQDPDVLDTWFSAALWPFSTLGWPDETEDLERYYPSSVMETGYDILFLWVHRMIFSGLEFMGQAPFPDVYLHGQVRDAQGQRMSKSKGNGIDPTIVTAEYGSDALRLALVTAGPVGSDLKLSVQRVESMRNFANKIWNATRYVLRATAGVEIELADDGSIAPPGEDGSSLADRWILSRLSATTSEVTGMLERYQLNEAGRRLYEFVWSEYCDWYLEATKVALGGTNETARRSTQQTLVYVLDRILRLLHPFMPFVTEELWHHLPHRGDALIVAPWPEPGERDERAEREFELLIEVVRSVRNARAEHDVPPARLIPATIAAGTAADALLGQADVISRLARIEPGSLEIQSEVTSPPEDALSLVVASDVQVYLPLAGMVDPEEQRRRLEADLAAARSEAERARGLLSNEQFTRRAPEHVVERERARLAVAEERARLLEDRLSAL